MPLLSSTSVSAAARILVVVNKQLPGITVYNADTLQPISQAKTGVAPHEVALSADGRHAYVPIYGSGGVWKPGTDGHLFRIFRTSDCAELGTIDMGEFKRPHGMAVSKSGTIYVTSEIASAVILIDPDRQQIIAHIPTGSTSSHMIALNADETRLYCSNVRSKTLSVLDTENRTLLASIETGTENQRMTVSPNGQWFVTSLGPAHAIAFYRTTDHQIDFQAPVNGLPFTAKFSSDGTKLFNVGFDNKGQTCAWKIDVAARQVVGTVENLGHDPGSLEVNPFDGNVYVSDQPTNRITIIDPASWRTVATMTTDASPDSMAFATVA